MCGLVGFWGGKQACESMQANLNRMANTIVHRGPDDMGSWIDPEQQIAFGHRRLAVVDLSPAGHQPMTSCSGRYVLVFNGEIYNHLELRKQLILLNESLSWRGHSDTETLLAGFDAWGVQETIVRCIGMFAMAIWDRHANTLTLVRDRLGEKPLYYGWQDGVFLFGSELKSLRAHPSFKADISRGSLALFLRHAYVPAPYSIYQDIFKLKPGSMLVLSADATEPTISSYWSGVDVAKSGCANPFRGDFTAAVDGLDSLLSDAVRQQMMADVPLGAFLSGGIDSSTVVALMQAQSTLPIKTFTIGFSDEGYNEAVHAKAVAAHLGTEHTELYVSPEQAMAVIPLLPTLYDEPFADSSQIPTFLVSQLAKQHVTVSLSGDAGDELFCGYNRYQITAKSWGKLSRFPKVGRQLLANGILRFSPKELESLLAPFGVSKKWAGVGYKMHKGAAVLASDSLESLYYGLVSQWSDPLSVVLNAAEPATLLTGARPALDGIDPVQQMMVLDLLTYLPDDILVKVDRASMGVSLESRVPFLDHRVVEFAWSLPLAYKLREGQTKSVLREVLYRYVPRELIERPKMGFGIPIDSWLRGPLRDWCEALLDESRLIREGFFNPLPIRAKWQEHLSGSRNWGYQLWNVLMFQMWLEQVHDA